jgi:hypothetical protein
VIFLMVEIPTPKPYIFMIRVNRQIKCPKSWDPGSSPSPTESFFENYTYLWNHFVNFNQTLPKCSLGYSLVSYLFIKQDQLILTCNSAVASLMLSRFFIFPFINSTCIYLLFKLHVLHHNLFQCVLTL